MTAQWYVDRARELLNEESANFYTDATILAWISTAAKEMARITKGVEKTKTFSLVENLPEYSYDTGVLKLKNVTLQDDNTWVPLEEGRHREIVERFSGGHLATKGTPRKFEDFERKVYVYPRPDESAPSIVVTAEVWTTAATTITTNIDTSDFPSMGILAINNNGTTEVVKYYDITTSAFLQVIRGQEDTDAIQKT